MSALFTTVTEIVNRKNLKKNERSVEQCHLHFNGPGAAGFGVKRTAMLLPESVMLLVAPSCCGRHGTVTGSRTGFDDRMFYLQITERDLVTGKYLARIPQAAGLAAKHRPKVIFLCMTCADAMMGTDLDRIARQVEAETGIKTVGSFMDPISREGRKAPMVSVQRAIYSALEPAESDEHAANIIGNFVPLDGSSELYGILKNRGYHNIRQISACSTYEEYRHMAEASLNIVINPQAVQAAEDMKNSLGIPYIHVRNCFGPERIENELKKLNADLKSSGTALADRLHSFSEKYSSVSFGIGEAVNGSNLELALALLEAGADVRFVFKNIITDYDLEIFRKINEIRPELTVYSGVHPSMNAGGRFPESSGSDLIRTDVTIGLDAGYLSPDSSSVCWSMERQTFGYSGMNLLLDKIEARIAEPVPVRNQIHGSYLTV